MDPQINDDQAIGLPQPQAGGQATMPLPAYPAAIAGPVAVRPDISAQPTMPGNAGMMPVPSAAPPLSLAPPVSQPASQSDTAAAAPAEARPVAAPSADQSADVPAEAADSDVIEREWIVKAKQIVAANQSNPYRLAQEMNSLKADYMKKRYNKEVKLPDA